MKDAAWITLRLRKNRTFPVTLSGQQDIRGGGCRLPSRRATVLPLVDGTVHPKRPSCRSNSWAEPAYSRRNLNEAGGLFGRTAHEFDDFGVCGKFPQVLPRCRTCFWRLVQWLSTRASEARDIGSSPVSPIPMTILGMLWFRLGIKLPRPHPQLVYGCVTNGPKTQMPTTVHSPIALPPNQ